MRHSVRCLWVVLLVGACIIADVQAQTSPTGTVTVSYTLTRISKMASNQFAVWIEDETGRHIRTLFATDFMARRQGWKIRPQVCPTWIRVADVNNLAQRNIDAVSGATPQGGKLSAVWDLKDAEGTRVAAGLYLYRIEGNLFRDNTVLWTGKIRIGGAPYASRAVASYSPEGAEMQGVLISEVSAIYVPGP